MSKVHTAQSLDAKLAEALSVKNRRTLKVPKKKGPKLGQQNRSTSSKPLTTTSTVSKTTSKVEWKSRKDSGKVVLEIGEKPEMGESNPGSVTLEHITKVQTPFRYMYDKLRQKSDVLSNHLTDVGELLLQQNNLGYATPIVTNSGSECTFVGRILVESETGEGKLNQTSILLEGFNDEEQIRSSIVKLDVSALDEAIFFPGQIVAVKGTKDSQKNIIKASECFNKVTYPSSERRSTTHQTIIVASGPFTTQDNLSYEPLSDLLDSAITDEASLLILIGPFISHEHEMIKNDEVDDTFDEIFQSITKKINDKCRDAKLKVVLVPSLLDIHHDYVYPQPPFELDHEKKSVLQSTTNPAIFNVDGICVAVCAHDILNQIKQVEYVREKKPHSQMELTQMRAEILFNQRSLYPLYTNDWNVPFDSSFANIFDIEVLPDLLILPTDSEEPFALNVAGVLTINPKHLGTFDELLNVGGTYAKIVIPVDTKVLDAYVQIKRI